MDYTNTISATFGLCAATFGLCAALTVLFFLFGIAGLNLVILADFLKRRMIVSCLTAMTLSFLIAFTYESTIQRAQFGWIGFLLFCLFFFSMPMVRLFFLEKNKARLTPKTRFSRIFEGAVYGAAIPCVFGLILTMSALVTVTVNSDPHGLRSGNWAHGY